MLSETKSETEIAIRDNIRNKIGTMDEIRQLGFDNINNVNTCRRLELQWVTTCWQDSSKQFQTAWWKYTVHRLFLLVPLICSMPRVTRKISQGILFISQGHIIFIGRWRFLKINKFDKNGISYCNINGGETGVSAASHLHVCRQQLRLAKLIFMLKHVLYWCGEVWIRLKDPNAGDVCQC